MVEKFLAPKIFFDHLQGDDKVRFEIRVAVATIMYV